MGPLTIELPAREDQTEFNERRWAELVADSGLAKLDGRIETDRHGHIIMTPPPAPKHGSLQSEIAHQLRIRISNGRVITECPISTADGVKGTDVAWASAETMRALGARVSFPRAPDVCVEVLSPSNTDAEMREKTALYFDAGAREVWICADTGAVTFFHAGETTPRQASAIFTDFPSQIVLG
jgi:Uma2 family endonuclease